MFKRFFYFLFTFFLLIPFIGKYPSKCDLYYPSDYTSISSYYGYRVVNGIYNFHNGVDFLAPQGSSVYSILPGIVSYAGFMEGYGNTVIVTHTNGYKSLYGHLDENFMVKIGIQVNDGQIIAKVGPKYLSNGKLNGFTTGPHLHFTIFDNNGTAIDPLNYTYKKRK